MSVITQLGVGIAGGIGWGLLGYLRALNDKEGWDSKKFAKALVLGAVIGGIGGFYGYADPDTAMNFVKDAGIYAGLTALVDKVITWVYTIKTK